MGHPEVGGEIRMGLLEAVDGEGDGAGVGVDCDDSTNSGGEEFLTGGDDNGKGSV
jgi:hypothetical protein